MSAAALLEVSDLRLSVPTDEGVARILDSVSLTLERGRILGLVGESGCGKSTLGRAVLGLKPRNAVIESGRIVLDGRDVLALAEDELNGAVRGKLTGFIPQDPYLALNPVFRIGAQLLPMLKWHGPELKSDKERRDRLVGLLRRVQIPEPETVLERYPHQFSGGQRQRLLIAAALAARPSLVIADEPTTALDVTTQKQILVLLKELTAELGVSMLFITHDFGVVSELCDDITVMYAGQTVESGASRGVLDRPLHPYTQALLACHPDRSDALTGIPGLVPSPLSPPPGCRFAPRCALAMPACSARAAALRRMGPGRLVSCRLADEAAEASP